MAVKEVLLDTNAYVAFKQGQAEAVEIVRCAARETISKRGLRDDGANRYDYRSCYSLNLPFAGPISG